MLETVDSTGQISLGKQFAGQRFSVQVRDQGVVVLQPIAPGSADSRTAGDAPAALTEEDQRWTQDNRALIEAYNAWAERRPSFSSSVHEWRRGRADAQRTRPDQG